MKKELEIFIGLSVAGGLALSACGPRPTRSVGEAETQLPTPVSFTATPVMVRAIETATAEVTPISSQTALPTLTPEPLMIYPTMTPTEGPTLLGNRETISGTVLGLTLDTTFLKLSEELTLIEYFATSADEQAALNEMTGPGRGTAATYLVENNSLLLVVHSGYKNHVPLEAESMRLYIEGSDGRHATATEEEMLNRMRAFEGRNFQVTVNGSPRDYVVFSVQKIPHQEVANFSGDSSQSLTVAREIELAVFGSNRLEFFTNNQTIVLSFCGWARADEAAGLSDSSMRYTYSRYLLYLVPQ